MKHFGIMKHLILTCVPSLMFILSGCAANTLSKSKSVTFQRTVCYQRADGTYAMVVRGSVFKRSFLNRIEPHVVNFLERRKVFKTKEEADTADQRLALFLDDN